MWKIGKCWKHLKKNVNSILYCKDPIQYAKKTLLYTHNVLYAVNGPVLEVWAQVITEHIMCQIICSMHQRNNCMWTQTGPVLGVWPQMSTQSIVYTQNPILSAKETFIHTLKISQRWKYGHRCQHNPFYSVKDQYNTHQTHFYMHTKCSIWKMGQCWKYGHR